MAFDFKKVFSSIKKTPIAKATKVVGIDFGSSSIKVVEVEKVDEVISLSTYGELQLGPYGESDMGSAVKLPLSKRIESVVDVLRESGVSSKDGVLSLPLTDSFVTIMSLTAKEDEDIVPRVRVEARKYIPVPLTDVALEWSEIPPLDDKPALTREVLLAAIQNNALDELTSVLEAIQMTSKPAEIELFSTLRAITKETDTSVAVIDLGAHMSKLYIAEGGFLRRIHRVQAGGSYATKALSQALNTNFETAENLKRNYSPSIPEAVQMKKVMSQTFERSFQEFKRVIGQYELRTGKPVSRVVLTGGSVLFPELASMCGYALDREVEVTNPFNKIAYPAFMEDTLVAIAPIFTVALGAALRQFEL